MDSPHSTQFLNQVQGSFLSESEKNRFVQFIETSPTEEEFSREFGEALLKELELRRDNFKITEVDVESKLAHLNNELYQKKQMLEEALQKDLISANRRDEEQNLWTRYYKSIESLDSEHRDQMLKILLPLI
jgi:hypothetical protein